MSFVSASIVGSSFVAGISDLQNIQYNSIQFNGESKVDKVRIVDYAMTVAELDALSISDVYTWDERTLLYAEFTNNLNAGSIVVATTIESWNVLRFCCGSSVPEVIATGLHGSEKSIIDYTAVKPDEYFYRIYPITATAVIAGVQSNIVEMCYDYYAFLDEITGDSFTFMLNLEGMGKSLNSSASTYEGFTQYPAKSQGLLKYNSSSFSALLGNVVGNYYSGDTVATYKALEDFITNGNEKIMKDRKGNIYRVFTENLTSNIDEKPDEMPTMISFQWTEVGEV